MLRRTKGRLLLTLLVITGLAGTINDTSLSKKERKFAIGLMKDTKAEIIKNVKGLSPQQINFKADPGDWSIREHLYQLTLSQNTLWDLFQSAMKKPANPEQRPEIKFTDKDIVAMLRNTANKNMFSVMVGPRKANWKTTDAALADLKSKTSSYINYINSSTEDMRNRVVHMPFGWIDCYQLSLVITTCNDYYSRQISEIKKNPKFPPE